MINFPPFHLTIDAKGLVSLWDNAFAARSGMEINEVYVPIQPTPEQMQLLIAAQRQAILQVEKDAELRKQRKVANPAG